MLTKDFYFDLPDDLIAQYPSSVRGQDKLLVLERKNGNIIDSHMEKLTDFIEPNTLMIFNNSRVRYARCFAQKLSPCKDSSGNNDKKPVEFFLLNTVDIEKNNTQLWRAMVKPAKKQRVGNQYIFSDGTIGTIEENPCDTGTEFRTLSFSCPNGNDFLDESWFQVNGHIPLPPYIKRGDMADDSERYQNIYADVTGSVACPTAGLHFTQSMLDTLQECGVSVAYITLHVGLGTFLPIRTTHIEEHTMHNEVFTVDNATANLINNAKADGKNILAVGTTSVRALESAWDSKKSCVQSGTHATDIFLYPGAKFNVVNQLFTNFHTPESTLLMLVSAFAGKEHIFNAYRHAVDEKYRFFSYGDAMFIR